MHDAFSAIHDLDTSATYILIDDVVTTGATLEAAIDALQNAGARHTLPVALAH
jgi:predicted amidophosphoribosyltransferase